MALTRTTSDDSGTLALLGKKQALKRRFGFWSLLGFAVCELITWETVLALFSQSFENGGPAGALYGFIIAWASTLSVYTVISELASMAPIAGGQYYWTYLTAPPRWKILSSYIVGWLTSIAWVATVAIQTIFAGTILQGLVILCHDDYVAREWQGMLMAWAVVASGIFINTVTPGLLPKFEIFIVVFHIAGFIAVVTTLWVCTTPRHDSSFVFTTSLNEGGWPTQGISYCVGFLGNVATFVGADASVHLAEETENAARNIPRAIIAGMCVNGAVGFVTMITILFCLGDVDSVLETATGYPFIQVFYNSVNNTTGAAVMGAVVLALVWSCAIGICTTASRMIWSFARDRGTPFGSWLSVVTREKRIPFNALCVACGLAASLALIYLGSYTVFNDVVSLTINGFYLSYLIPSAFLLYHRVKGNVAPHRGARTDGLEADSPAIGDTLDTPSSDAMFASERGGSDDSKDSSKPILGPSQQRRQSSIAHTQLRWGPFHLPGWFGIANNAYACTYMVFVIFWSFWPPQAATNAVNMNYSIVVLGGVIILSILWYFVRGRKEYQGPTIDEEIEAILKNASATK
ncbi:hypothetical protein LTS08_003907 [Lithohypha guttulata]|nr:hypothetical protein LTS08_003907 [Lithohypha guttulata]